jgi:hypothetical protein
MCVLIKNTFIIYVPVQSLLSSRLQSRNVKVKIYKTIMLPVVLFGCETWSVTSREDHKQRVFENRELKRMFVPKRDEVTGEYGNLLGRSNQGELGGWDMWHAWERTGKFTRFWWKSPKERYHLEDQGVDGRMGSEWILGRLAGGVYDGFSWLRIGDGIGVL